MYKYQNYNQHPFVPIGMEALVHNKPHKRRTFAKHCTKAFVLGTSTKHYQCWKFWIPTTRATRISGGAFFKHKYLTNPSVMPEDQVIAAAACLTDTLEGIKSPQLHTSTLQALGDLCNVFYEAANATNAPLFAADTSPRQVAPLPPRDSPPVFEARNRILSPSQSPCTPPRMQPNLAPDLATILFGWEASLILSDVPPQQIAPPTPTPISPTKPLHRSQQIANLGILTANTCLDDTPAHNMHSQVQHHTFTQEAILACINTCNYISSRSLTPANTARCLFPIKIINAVLDMDTGKLLEMRHLLVNPKYKELWGKSYTTELGRLVQGIPGVSTGTDTIMFIAHNEILFAWLKDVTYGCVCVNYRPKKDDPNCTRLTIGDNKVNFPEDCSTPTVYMVTVKLHLNSVISTKGACYCTIDLKDFYIMTPITRPEYMHMKIKDLPEEFITMYNLVNKATSDGYVYIRICTASCRWVYSRKNSWSNI